MRLLGDFITTVFPIARTVLVCVIAVAAIVLTICALMQSTDSDESTNALTGQESYYSQNKGENRDVKLKRITIIMASIIAVSCILYFVSMLINATPV